LVVELALDGGSRHRLAIFRRGSSECGAKAQSRRYRRGACQSFNVYHRLDFLGRLGVF
jgi:hypothetical protein